MNLSMEIGTNLAWAIFWVAVIIMVGRAITAFVIAMIAN